ncbi:MAG TPA: carbon-nitrogen family hydrolase [Candidatus Avidesulfovibrio excrementigallinarum]|nr:carbon-nitrogen family hydrolase [Candidatus Avidesulfovibrio excrementigallinarum]
MRAAALQYAIAAGKPDANLTRVEQLVRDLMTGERPPDVIALPEMWSTGFALRHRETLATPCAEREVSFLRSLATRYHVAFAGGSVLAEDRGRYYNRTLIMDADGRLIDTYDKVHLFHLLPEGAYLTPGRRRVLFHLRGVPCSCLICYDMRFGPMVQRLALDGAQVIFVGAQWPLPRVEHWDLLARARAVENQVFMVASNCCGQSRWGTFAGRSQIVAPDGTVLAKAGDTEEGAVTADLDLDLIKTVRAEMPVFADRVPEVYV